MLALKLTLLPGFLLFLSLAGRWWGPAVAGWLAGFPVVAAPILFLICLEHGGGFTGAAAVLTLGSIAGSEAFNFAYAWTCLSRSWPVALAAGLAAWLAVSALLVSLPPTLAWTGGVSALATLMGQRFLPRSPVPMAGLLLRWPDLALRMAAGALLTLLVTGVSGRIGTGWSGLLAAFPMLGVTLSVASHRAYGPPFVVALLRGMVLGRFSFAAFCLCLALLAPRLGAGAFALALTAAAVVQGLAKAVSAAAGPPRRRPPAPVA